MTKQQIEAFKRITPGPWAAEIRRAWHVYGPYPSEPGEGEHIALMNCTERAESHAITIAALPELLKERAEMIAALRSVITMCLNVSDLYRSSGNQLVINSQSMKQAQSVLARAEGEEKP